MMTRPIARRQLIKVLAVDAVAFPVIALVLLTMASPSRFLWAILVFAASTSIQGVVFVQGSRQSRAQRCAGAHAQT